MIQSRTEFFIGGRWVPPTSAKRIEVVSPFTEEVIATVPEGSEADVDRAVAAARAAFEKGPWPHLSTGARADSIARLSQGIQARAQEFADTITAEMGAPASWAI